MTQRTVEDRLREEYVSLLPHLRRVAEALEAEVRYLVIPVCRELKSYERIVVRSRVKECESALDALKRRQEGKRFDRNDETAYSLRSLHDLVGVRVLAFPKKRLLQVDRMVRERSPAWIADPVPGPTPAAESMAFKYHGSFDPGIGIRAELQVVAMPIGLFWEVEHAALYKPGAALATIDKAEELNQRNREVILALRAFEAEFDTLHEAPASAGS